MITNPEDTSTTTSIVFAQEKAGYKGVWVPFDDGFQLYLPADWNTYELSEEEINQGLLYAAGDTSGSDTAPAVSVSTVGEESRGRKYRGGLHPKSGRPVIR